MDERSSLLSDLLSIGVFRCGDFVLKSGVKSPIYLDLRLMISHPRIVSAVVSCLRQMQAEKQIEAGVICGVPYTALPIASVFSVRFDVPMLIRRKEVKAHGTKKAVEGVTQQGQKCLILEDIVSSGGSVLETAAALQKEGLVITDCFVVVDREQGARDNLKAAGINLHALFCLREVFDTYCKLYKPDPSLDQTVKLYLETNAYIPVRKERQLLPFSERAGMCEQPVAKRLFQVMADKKTNLCVAVDVLTSKELLKLADLVGSHICLLKTHIDILTDFSSTVIRDLRALALKHNFLIFEDRKFTDIGNTVLEQYSQGMYKIKDWAEIVTVNGNPGDGVVEALSSNNTSSASGTDRACVLVAEMSSKGAFTDENFQQRSVEMAERHEGFVIGFVAQHLLTEKPNLIQMCPGVNIDTTGDGLGQQYNSPEMAVKSGADVIIVGRGICRAEDIVASAIEYKNKGYKAYTSMCEG